MAGKISKLSIVLFFLSSVLYLGLLPFIQYPLTSFIKPIPIFLLMVIALQSNVNITTKKLLITALIFSLLGDISLTIPGDMTLKIGILFFMLAHCAYITLYFKDGQFQLKRLVYFLPVLAFIVLSYYYMLPYLGKMTIPVTVYLCFLTFMVFSAFLVIQHPLLIISGACLFLVSDFIFALMQFVFSENKYSNILIMLSYYFAQFLLVAGLIQRQTITTTVFSKLYHVEK
ncbi:lysoplasmalogenase [Legionella brunensis]|uniref:lysoplasmalogenase n=1 Tax=Legionella brunensis TaxID=29422 RepID=UPI0010417961|nr:lysoplasmalogenase [Legionella brunensis]